MSINGRSRLATKRPFAVLGSALVLVGAGLGAVAAPSAAAPAALLDNGKLAFVSDATPVQAPGGGGGTISGDFSIWTMNPDGTGAVDVGKATNQERQEAPSFSLDGTKIAFSQTDEDAFVGDIIVMDSNGTGKDNLTDTDELGEFGESEEDPAFAPDGSEIAFGFVCEEDEDPNNAECNDPDPALKVIDVAAPNAIRTVDDGLGRYSDPAYSPDAMKIAFAAAIVDPDPTDGELPTTDIYVIDADGMNLIQVTNTLTVDESDPSFTANGLRIVFENSPTALDEAISVAIIDAAAGAPPRPPCRRTPIRRWSRRTAPRSPSSAMSGPPKIRRSTR